MMKHSEGALEKLTEYFDIEVSTPGDPVQEATYLLTWLWNEGFKIVPIEEKDGD
jgi:hypothetical protein